MDATPSLVVRSHGDFGGTDVFDQIGSKTGEEVVVGVVGFRVCVVQDEHFGSEGGKVGRR